MTEAVFEHKSYSVFFFDLGEGQPPLGREYMIFLGKVRFTVLKIPRPDQFSVFGQRFYVGRH